MSAIKCIGVSDTHVGLVVSKEFLIQLYACWWATNWYQVGDVVQKTYAHNATDEGKDMLPIKVTPNHGIEITVAMQKAGLFKHA